MFPNIAEQIPRKRKDPGPRELLSRRGIAAVLGAALITSLLTPLAAQAAEPWKPTSPARVDPVPVTEVVTLKSLSAAQFTSATPKVSWPSAGAADVDLEAARRDSRPQKAGKLPVFISPGPSTRVNGNQVRVQVFDRDTTNRIGVDGLLIAVTPKSLGNSPGNLNIEVDYTGFRHAYGADWDSRLRLVRLPACALTTPEAAECRTRTPLPYHNNAASGIITAQIQDGMPKRSLLEAPQFVLAAEAGTSGAKGNYTATTLGPSSSWTAGGSAGGFSWSYPIEIPSSPGGPEPVLALSYSSQTLDGRTAATNNQASWIGDGWSMESGFIERRYQACKDDRPGGNNSAKAGDLCWFTDNATLSLNGKNTELVKSADGTWKSTNDSAEKIERLTGADNGDNDGEHWKLTTANGTQYFFGLSKLPGANTQRTNSAWSVPVFGNHEGEECHKSPYADSWCQQGWRWNLDYVVDPNGNAMAYFYETETNYYGRNGNTGTGTSTATPYIRGGWLSRIEYGHRADSLFSAKAPVVVRFDVAERCLPNGTMTCSDTQFTKDNAKSWPDTPADLYCKADSECKGQFSPSFWSRKRLTTITTQVLNNATHQDIDTWVLEHQFPDSGDGQFPLWLASITRIGKAGTTALALPPVTFGSEQLENRVDGKENIAPFWRRRVNKITTETGATTQISYSTRDCTRTALPDPASNGKRCYPVNWSPDGGDKPVLDWFHKYIVTQVLEADNTGGGKVQQTDYEYVGAPAWRKSTDEFTKESERTYSDFRGYSALRIRTGGAGEQKTLNETRYFRGIPGAKVADSEGATVDDHEALVGVTREAITYNGDNGPIIAATSFTPWVSAPTATRSRTGLPALNTYQTGTTAEHTRTAISDGTWRHTEKTTTYDSYGMVRQHENKGDVSLTGDEQCTRTEYARNVTDHLISYVSREETVGVACAATPVRPRDVVDDERTLYDGGDFGVPPSKGLVTAVQELNSAGTPTTRARFEHDSYGRPVKEWDVHGQPSTTKYIPALGQLPTELTVTNQVGHAVITTLDPRRALPTTENDANGVRTDIEYDALGRVVKVWKPGWDKAGHANKPSSEFSYLIRTDGPVAVTTKTLLPNGSYNTSIELMDSRLRPRQTQSTTEGGRLVTEKWYDTHGRLWREYAPYYAKGAPETTLVAGDDTKVPNSTETLFDGSGRPVAVVSKHRGTEKWRTTTEYGGDRTTIVPPAGGTTRTSVTDALGRVREIIDYTTGDRSASQSTRYEYNVRGGLTKVTDASGNTWSYEYDARGNPIHVRDPDTGESWMTYDDDDRVKTAKNALGVETTTDYDALGRRISFRQGETVRAEWAYDTAPGGKGQLASSTRHADEGDYTTVITGYSAHGQPTGTTVTLPANTGTGLSGPFTWQYAYNPETGKPTAIRHPALADLPAETVTLAYDSYGRLQTTGSSMMPYAGATTYDPYGRVTQYTMGSLGKKVVQTSNYDEHTGRLITTISDQESTKSRISATDYTYDPVGNITRISTTDGQDTSASTDTQCFAYDALSRMTSAWTALDACATRPQPEAPNQVGGPDSYWTDYTYDAVGNRTTETLHATGDDIAGMTRIYHLSKDDEKKPGHALIGVTTHGPNGITEDAYTYDATGNTTGRTLAGRSAQTLEWDAEGKLAKVIDGADTTTYAYDADGNRVLRRDTTGTTIYLPGGTEIRRAPTGTLTGTRWYSHGEETVASRNGTKVSFLLRDHHDTATAAVDHTTQAVTRRRITPFGQVRGDQPASGSWPDDKGFLGKTADSTDLTHLDAREYDPSIGRFISVDPVMDLTDPQQTHGYTYANNNPTTLSDPDGLRPVGACDPTVWCSAGRGEAWTYAGDEGWTYTKRTEYHEKTRYTDRNMIQVVTIPDVGGVKKGKKKTVTHKVAPVYGKSSRNKMTHPVVSAIKWGGGQVKKHTPQPVKQYVINPVLQHTQVSLQGCALVLCLGVTYQDGHLIANADFPSIGIPKLNAAGLYDVSKNLVKRGYNGNLVGLGGAVGFNTKRPHEQADGGASICAFYGPGGCISGAPAEEGGNFGMSIGVGGGVFIQAGNTRTYHLWD